MTPPVEPEAEPLTDEELDDARVGRTLDPSYDDARWLATIDRLTRERDALLSQLREQRERADKYERFFRASDANLGTTQAAYAHEVLRADAAERTVREQREALERIAGFGGYCTRTPSPCRVSLPGDIDDWCPLCQIADLALAALAPNTEGEGT